MARRGESSGDPPRASVTLALAVCLVVAGCAGFAGDNGGARTVNPALAETPTATPTPPGGFPTGVDRDGVDTEELIAAHRTALGNGSWTVTLTRTVAGENETIEQSQAVARVDGPRLLYTFERVRGENRLATAHWSNATASASRRESWRGNVTLSANPAEAGGPTGLDPTGGAWLSAVFVDMRPEYAGTEQTANGTVTVLEATAGRIERSGVPDRRQVRLRARVDGAGVVRSLVLQYDVFLGDDPATIRIALRTDAVGSTTVPRPEWVDRAFANATGDGSAGNATSDS